MLNILLITPGRRIHAGAHLDAILKSAVAPADLATVAALTPPEHRVEIWDEAIRGELKSASDLPRHYDIIGVGGYSSDGERTLAIGGLLKGIPTPVVVGGVGVSSEPERYRDHFDVLFIGEAEYTWPRFLSDYQAGKYETEYRQVGRVSMEDAPPPNWDLIAGDLEYYAWGVVQTTRGCPFDCEFCDVITLFGRKPRHKPIDQVLGEVEALQRLGVRAIMWRSGAEPQSTRPRSSYRTHSGGPSWPSFQSCMSAYRTAWWTRHERRSPLSRSSTIF